MGKIMNIDNETIKQIFFHCENSDPEGIYPEAVDIVEFANKIAEYVDFNARKEEHERCIAIASEVNSKVAELLFIMKP